MDEKITPEGTDGKSDSPVSMAEVPASERITEKSMVIVDDAARKDGGRTVSRVAIAKEQLDKVKHNAIDKTREESGS